MLCAAAMMNNPSGVRAHHAGNIRTTHLLGALALLASAALGGCVAEAVESSTPQAEARESGLAASKAPAARAPSPDTATTDTSSVRASGPMAVRAGALTVTVEPTAVPEVRAGERVWVMTGRSSRSLSEAVSFVPDDGFGDTTLLDSHTFEIALRDGHEINTILSGMPLFLHLRTRNGSPDVYAASIALAPRFSHFEGSSAVRFDAPVAPVFFLDDVSNLRYRATVRTTWDARRVTVLTPGDTAPALVASSPRVWAFDWTFERLAAAADPPGAPVAARAHFGGRSETKRAVLDIAVRALGLTTGSPEVVWPAPGCSEDVARCIAEQPAGAVDFAACGAYRQVAACRSTALE
jgi:hypothetical protein